MKITIKNLTQILILLFAGSAAFGQGEIPVDMFTGTPAVSIPIYTVTDHDISETVGLTYNTTGVRLEDQSGIAGLGWNLRAGGAIYRRVRGLPDDYLGTGADTRSGWFYNNNASNAGSFSTTADLLAGASNSDEATAYSSLSGVNYKLDTEPDIFYYSAGGVSGAFVFDNALNIRLIPYRDVKIEYVVSSNKITSFTITSNDGVKYIFDLPVQVTKSAHRLTVSAVEYLKREFYEYDIAIYNPGASFNQEWKLTQMQSPAGAAITYTYITGTNSVSADTVRVGVRKLNSSDLFDLPVYYTKTTVRPREIKSISSSTGETVEFEMQEGVRLISRIKIRHKRRASTLLKEFQFDFQNPVSQDTTSSGFARSFLKSIQEVSASQCETIPPYTFTYINVDFANNICSLPSVSSKAKDFWGYYNGKLGNTSFYPKLYVYPNEPAAEKIRIYPKTNNTGEYILPGADRMPDAKSMQVGSLKMITYPSGGATVINYEPHEFYDAAAAQTFIGGGLRVKSIVTYDGVSAANNMVKNFEYKEVSGTSSGRLINRPFFAVPVSEWHDPEGNTIKSYNDLSSNPQLMYEYLIARTNYDLSRDVENDIIGYSRVKVSRPGSGSAEFEYALPSTYGTASSGTWAATEDKFVRSSGSTSMGVVTSGGIFSYPYVSNPNFSFERGLLQKKTEKDESGDKVTETVYTYQPIYKTGSNAFTVWGVSYDYYTYSSSAYFFGKYGLLTDVAKVVDTETTISYDANDVSKFVTSSQQYFYESSYHKLLTRSTSTSIDGTVITNRTKYPLDFGTITLPADAQLTAIKNLQSGFRNGVAIEQTTSMQKAGGSDRIVSASLVKLSDFGVSGKVYPYQNLSLKTDQGLTDFVNSGQIWQSTQYVFTHDSRYTVDNTFIAFDEYNVPLTTRGTDGIYKSTHWGFKKSLPVVQATNAQYNEFVFSNFETDSVNLVTGNEFTITPATRYPVGRTGNYSVLAVNKLSKTLQKANVPNYKLSFWLKEPSNAVSINVKIKDAAGSTTYFDNTFVFDPLGSDFQHFDKLISMAGVPSQFLVEVIAVNVPQGAIPLIDDISFHPENANLVSYTYDIPYGQNSITDATATTVHLTYDALGRERSVLDQDKNIIQKKTYRFQQPFTAEFSTSSTYDYTSIQFSANQGPTCDDVTYLWDFGNGFQDLGPVAYYGYTTTGTKSVTLKKVHPLYGEATITHTFAITPNPVMTVDICGKGAEEVECTTVISSFACSAITQTPTGIQTYWKVTGLSVNGTAISETASYHWLKSIDNGATWTEVSTTETSSAIPASNYLIKCYVTTTTGRSGYSNIETVIANCHP